MSNFKKLLFCILIVGTILFIYKYSGLDKVDDGLDKQELKARMMWEDE